MAEKQTGKTDEGKMVLVIGPFCWGKGETVKEAKSNCKRNAPSKHSPYWPKVDGKPVRSITYSAFLVTDDWELSDWGQVTATEVHPLGAC